MPCPRCSSDKFLGGVYTSKSYPDDEYCKDVSKCSTYLINILQEENEELKLFNEWNKSATLKWNDEVALNKILQEQNEELKEYCELERKKRVNWFCGTEGQMRKKLTELQEQNVKLEKEITKLKNKVKKADDMSDELYNICQFQDSKLSVD